MAINVHVIECNGPPTSAPDMVGQHWIDTSNGDHYLSNGTTDVSNWALVIDNHAEKVFEVLIPPLSSVDIATTALNAFCAIRYHMCVKNPTSTLFRSFMLHGGKKTDTILEHSIYASLGGGLNFSTNFSVSGSDALLTVTNNEAFPLTVRFRSEII